MSGGADRPPHPQPLSRGERGAKSAFPRGESKSSSPSGGSGDGGSGDGGRGDGSQGINSLYTMISGLFNPLTLLDVIRNFVYFPDTSRRGGEDPLPLSRNTTRRPSSIANILAHIASPERRRQGRHLLWRDGLRQELHHALPDPAADEERRSGQPDHRPDHRPHRSG